MSEKTYLGLTGREVLELTITGGIIYGALYLLKKAANVGSKVADTAATDVANAYVAVTNWLYGSYTVVPTGNVILPNGLKVPLAQVHVTFDDADNVGRFTYQGVNYTIAPNPSGGPAYDTNGDYHAQ